MKEVGKEMKEVCALTAHLQCQKPAVAVAFKVLRSNRARDLVHRPRVGGRESPGEATVARETPPERVALAELEPIVQARDRRLRAPQCGVIRAVFC